MFMPDLNESWMRMPCAEYEERILDLLHGQLAEPARSRAEAHLTACPACRQFAAELAALDAALAAEFPRPELPPSFKRELLHRIDRESADVAPGLVAQRKQAMEAEFQQQSAGLLRCVVRDRWNSILDGFGLLGLSLMAAVILQQVVRHSPDFLVGVRAAAARPTVTWGLWAGAAVCVAGAVWFGLQPEARRLRR